MSTEALEIKGLAELQRAIAAQPEKALPILTRKMDDAVKLLAGVVKTYPPATEANQPGRISITTHRPMGFYDRGQGWWYPVMRSGTLGERPRKSAGALKGPAGVGRALGIAGYKLRRTSERLREHWTTEVRTAAAAVEGTVGTNVSYADHVQGEQQAHIHQARGWVTLGTALDRTAPDILRLFEDGRDEIVAAFNKGGP